MSLLEQLTSILAQPPADGWQSHDFAALDQLHIGGLAATKELLRWLPAGATNGLDMGGGLGGCARLLATHYACQMTVSDLNSDYIAAGQLLNQHLQPQPACHYVVANSLKLPFAKHSFDFVLSQHAMMAIADKQQVLAEAARVVSAHGHLLLHEVYLTPNSKPEEVLYPTPWADKLGHSHLQTWAQFLADCATSGWQLSQCENETQQSLLWINKARAARATPASPLNARLALGSAAGKMSANIMANLQAGRLEVRRALLVKSA